MTAPSKRVTVIDYGIGNLHSVQRSLEHCGAEVRVATTAVELEAAACLVLPGVGAFADGMQGLRDRGLVDAVRNHATKDRPLLGICLGMQMLATTGEEFGEHPGLDLIAGRVKPIPSVTTSGEPQRIPHIGWSELQAPAGTSWSGTILDGVSPTSAVYLTHSFVFVPSDPGDVVAQCIYGGHALNMVVRRGNTWGCQFHPEKSGPVGLEILRRFLVSA